MRRTKTAPSPENESQEHALVVPWWFRVVAIVLSVCLLAPGAVYFLRQWRVPASTNLPADPGVAQLMIAGTIVALVALAPWKGLQLRLRKVGFFEFDRVINTQAREHIEEFAELRARIEELETRVRGLDSVGPIAEHFADVDLMPLLIKFLADHAPRAFSPLRVREWGARQEGYEKLRHYTQGAIRTVLQKLVATGKVATRVSQFGNTLYKIAD